MATSVSVIGSVTATCVVSAAAIAVFVPSWPARDIAVGMAGPLLAACVTWWLVERTWRTNPAGLSGVMMGAFAIKLVLFGVYVVFALRGLQVAVVPFIATFTLYFVGLYAAEAVLLHKLFSRARVLS